MIKCEVIINGTTKLLVIPEDDFDRSLLKQLGSNIKIDIALESSSYNDKKLPEGTLVLSKGDQ